MRTKSLTKERLLANRKITKLGCWLWTAGISANGYGNLNSGGKQYKPHRVAAHLWLGMPLNYPRLVCHKCDVPACFNPKHLFIGTESDNIRDAIKKGRWACGERQGKAKLTWSTVREMRRQFSYGESKASLARKYKVSETTVREAVNLRTWKESS